MLLDLLSTNIGNCHNTAYSFHVEVLLSAFTSSPTGIAFKGACSNAVLSGLADDIDDSPRGLQSLNGAAGTTAAEKRAGEIF